MKIFLKLQISSMFLGADVKDGSVAVAQRCVESRGSF